MFLKELSKKEDFPSLGRRARGRAWRWMDMLYSNINVSPHQIVYDVTEGWPRTSKDQRFSAASHMATNRIVPREFTMQMLFLRILTMRILVMKVSDAKVWEIWKIKNLLRINKSSLIRFSSELNIEGD